MMSRHVNRALTEERRARWAELMIATAAEVLPDDARLQARIASIEWGSHIALQKSQPGYEPPPEADIPHWGWGKAGPPESAIS